MQNQTTDAPMISARWPELGMALFLMATGALVVFDSLRVGIGWADDGPRAGYFPFYIGLLLLGAASVVLVSTLRKWQQHKIEVFVTFAQLKLVRAVLVPLVIYVALMPALGLYLASALLMAYFMRQHGRYGWWRTVLVSVLVQVFFFWMFERWFLVLLPKGVLGEWLS